MAGFAGPVFVGALVQRTGSFGSVSDQQLAGQWEVCTGCWVAGVSVRAVYKFCMPFTVAKLAACWWQVQLGRPRFCIILPYHATTAIMLTTCTLCCHPSAGDGAQRQPAGGLSPPHAGLGWLDARLVVLPPLQQQQTAES